MMILQVGWIGVINTTDEHFRVGDLSGGLDWGTVYDDDSSDREVGMMILKPKSIGVRFLRIVRLGW